MFGSTLPLRRPCSPQAVNKLTFMTRTLDQSYLISDFLPGPDPVPWRSGGQRRTFRGLGSTESPRTALGDAAWN